jgi:hypothetical protein
MVADQQINSADKLRPYRNDDMKNLLATVALLCASSSALAHDIYSDLRDRDGRLCCNGQDCKPVRATVLPNGSYYLPETDETIPADMATPSPDDPSTIVWILQSFHWGLIVVDQYGAQLGLDASLLQGTLRSANT